MPIYEYRCNACKRRNTVFVRSFSATVDPACERCGSKDMSRLVSKFAVVKSEESRLDALADSAELGDVDENDPRSVARWARKMGENVGEELGPDWDQMIEQLEAGEMPDDVGGMDGEGGFDDGHDHGGEDFGE